MIEKDTMTITGSYALVKIADRNQLVTLYHHLLIQPHVVSCKAVEGEYDLILLVHTNSAPAIENFVAERIRVLKGVDRVDICEVELSFRKKPPVAKTMPDEPATDKPADKEPVLAESYLFLEVAQPRFEEVFRRLSSLPQVISCEVARGPYSLLLQLQAERFDLLDKLVEEKIRPLPGVLRVRQCRVIEPATM